MRSRDRRSAGHDLTSCCSVETLHFRHCEEPKATKQSRCRSDIDSKEHPYDLVGEILRSKTLISRFQNGLDLEKAEQEANIETVKLMLNKRDGWLRKPSSIHLEGPNPYLHFQPFLDQLTSEQRQKYGLPVRIP